MNEQEIELYQVLGDMLRNERIKRDMTLEQLAGKLGVTAKTVQRYECGERKIKLSTLMQITDVYGLNSNELVSRAQAKVGISTSETGNSYYLDDEVGEIAQEIYDDPNLRILLDASRKISKEDLNLVVDMVQRLKEKDK